MLQRYSRKLISEIWNEETKFQIWLDIEILACEAQNKLGLISLSSLNNIKRKAKFNVKRITEIEKIVKHDVIAFLTNISEHVGKDSRFIHMGMTSSDVLDTALSVQMVRAGNILLQDLLDFKFALLNKAKKYRNLIMIGRTHGIHAEPISLGLKFALWYDETNRNIERLKKAIHNISVGQISGAVGTYEHISPQIEKYVCRKLSLKTTNVSNQILQRDRHAEYISTLAIIGSCIEKYATEIRLLQKTETNELEEHFTKGQKGSSAMPHKKNPITCERLTGMARLLRSYSVSSLENIVLWHERDISHSSVERIILPDSTIILDYMLYQMTKIIDELVIKEDNIKKNLNLTKGIIFSQNVLLALVNKGITREYAYTLVQRNALKSWETKKEFLKIISKDTEIKKILTEKELINLFNYKNLETKINYIYKRLKIN